MKSTLGAVLFTDVAGSTKLRSRLGDDAADEVRRSHDRLLADAVEAHAGRLVKGLGDGIMATFSGAADAVAAAVAMQRGIERWGRRTPETSVGIRIGISGGDIAWEDGDCFGSPVVEASRLCAAADAGQILVADVVRVLVGSRGGHRFTPVGELTLKGLPAPIGAASVEWQLTGSDSGPLAIPPALVPDGQLPFAGRAVEREVLAKAWKATAAGDRRLVLVAGEPGIGKTRLSSELARDAHADGAIVLFGRCDEELGIPFQPFVEALRWFVTSTDRSVLGDRLGRHSEDLARVLPELEELVPGLAQLHAGDSDVEQRRLFDAIVSWLATIGTDRPVVLVLDDLHWAGRPTLLLLRHLVRSAERLPLLVVGTYRDTDLARTHPLSEALADFRREPGVERLRLTGLDEAGVLAFLEAVAGYDLDAGAAELAAAIHEETDGNPFFIGEVLVHLGESGSLARDDEGRWRATVSIADMPIPEGVREVVGRRVSRLSDASNTALRSAAVIGQEFELDILTAIAELDDVSIEEAIDEAHRAGLLREAPGRTIRFRFSHALVRSTLYEEVSSVRRVRLHRRIVEAIEQLHANRLDDYTSLLAYHASEAAAGGDVDRAVSYCRRAGTRALEQSAFDEAVTWFGRALDLLDVAERVVDETERAELLVALGGAQRRAGDIGHRATLLEAARLAQEADDAPLLAAAVIENFRGIFTAYGHVDHEKVATARVALERYDDAPSATRAILLAVLASELTFAGDHGEVRRLMDEAIAMAEDLGDQGALHRVLHAARYAVWIPETVRDHHVRADQLLALADAAGDPERRTVALGARFMGALQLGDVETAISALAERAKILGDRRDPAAQGSLLSHSAVLLYLAGRFEEALDRTDRARAFHEVSGGPETGIIWADFRFQILRDAGGCQDFVDEAVSILDGYGPLFSMNSVRILAEAGRLDDARARWEQRGAEALPARLARHQPWHTQAAMELTVAIAMGDLGTVAAIADLLRPHAGLIMVTPPGMVRVAVDHALGLACAAVGDVIAAAGYFDRSESIYERMAAVPLLGRVRMDRARATGDVAALADARRYCEDHDLLGVLADAEA